MADLGAIYEAVEHELNEHHSSVTGAERTAMAGRLMQQALATAPITEVTAMRAAVEHVLGRGLCPSCTTWFGPEQDPPHLPDVLDDVAFALVEALKQ